MNNNCNFCNGTGVQRTTPLSPVEDMSSLLSKLMVNNSNALGNLSARSEPICVVCLGRGLIEKPSPTFDCPFCKGKGGFVKYEYKELCHSCDGYGWLEGKQSLLDYEVRKQDHHRINCYIVFIDIVKYSLRKPKLQFEIVQKLNKILKITFDNINNNNKNLDKLKINLRRDSIISPIGDGVAITFPFDSVNNINLLFAEEFLSNLKREYLYSFCEMFDKNGWCKEHDHFKVRISLGKGDCLIYKDFNKKYNFAGKEVNLTSRIISKARPNEIVFTSGAFEDYTSLNTISEYKFKKSRFKDKNHQETEFYFCKRNSIQP